MSSSVSYRALLFDLDGTLAETDSLHLPTWVEVLAPRGIEVDEAFYKENISGKSSADIVRDLLPNLSDEEGRSIFEAKEASFRERAGELEPLPGLLDFLRETKGRGLATGLVTNAPGENVEAILPALKLQDFFDTIVLSDETEAVKPDPAPYNEALKRLGVSPEEALAFEDSVSGITSAVDAGIPTVGVASTQEPGRLSEAGVFVVVEDFTDPGLLALIRG
ncbi:HAD-IA family hydrolase [Rubrobacter tropicus]|uniref:HAD-IA family hydrolase n=1 Tax=Rubrobacter tropicus TaxID=2653851 RepID=A0A6G8QAS3_9ACTN|nr:HAD-IA family hydrolase [Rubrobacter tropicus]QIN83594.1 HAD-IA family hydrolase [Rubrobacter tropicus]